MVGRGAIAGIARHAFPKAPMELLDHVDISLECGIVGDYRGAIKPGGRGRRQVTLMEARDWAAATANVGRAIPWQERRVNLLVEGLDLPQVAGMVLAIGDVRLTVTRECNPCHRMEAVAPGLLAALSPDWRGGVCTRVGVGGTVAIGDEIWIDER